MSSCSSTATQSHQMMTALRRSRDENAITSPVGAVVVKAAPASAQYDANLHSEEPKQQQQQQKDGVPSPVSSLLEIKTQRVTVIESENQLKKIFSSDYASSSSSSSSSSVGHKWIAFIIHAPWSWPNFDPRRGFLKNILEKNNDRQEQEQEQQEQPSLSNWQWIVEQSQVPICSIDINTVPNANIIIKGITLSNVPMICLYNTENKSFIQKPCMTYIDIASQTLLPPIVNRHQLEEQVVVKQQEQEQQQQQVEGDNNYNNRHLVIAYIGAAWCPPCCRIMPHLPVMTREFKNASFIKIDFDAGQELVEAMSIEKIPTFCAFDMRKMKNKDDGEEDENNNNNLEFSSNGTQLPFGSLQNSDVVKVSEAVRKWCDLAETKQNKTLTEDMFTCDDF